jgi:Na+-transporting methylmalonyl-CoA/oxaloacetate decarboxylase beta subunit
MTKSAGTSKKRYTNLQVSQILAIGFLLVILSAAIWQKYQPLLVVATYVLAPLPNWICSHCANPDDFMESSGNAIVDFGRFLTGFLVLMGIGEFVSDCCFPVYRAC